MGHIPTPLKLQLSDDGKSWTLLEPMKYQVKPQNGGEEIAVPKDTPTDLASVPRYLRWFISTWKQTARAAVLHDYLYSTDGQAECKYTRKRTDAILLEVLEVMGHKTRKFAWAAVRVFGLWAWNKNAPKPGDT